MLVGAMPHAALAQDDDAAREQAFTAGMLARLRTALPGAELRIVPGEPLTIRKGKDDAEDGGLFYLNRIYEFCRNNNAEECEKVKADYVRKLTAPPPVAAQANLRVIVRDRQYLDYVLSIMKTPDTQPLYRQIGDDLFALLAIDSPEATSIANRATLSRLKLDEGTAWTLALRQTRDVLPPFPAARLARHQPVLFQDYEYLASLLAFADEWNAAAPTAGPDMFVTAVSDNLVFVGFLPHGPQLDKFRASVAADCKAQPRCITPNVYRLRDGRWVIDAP